MTRPSRFGHDPNPARDFIIEVGAIMALDDARAGGPISDELRQRVSTALDFITGGDRDAMCAKDRLRSIADAIRSELGADRREPGSGKVTITAPNGATYHLTLDGNDLWVHLEAAPGRVARLDWEENAGNEGWLRQQQRPALRATMPLRRPRAAA